MVKIERIAWNIAKNPDGWYMALEVKELGEVTKRYLVIDGIRFETREEAVDYARRLTAALQRWYPEV